MSNNKMKWFGLVILFGLFAAGGLIAWASPPDAPDGVEEGAVSTSASAPVPNHRGGGSRISMGDELVGTAVVEGGPSLAVFQSAGGIRMVREGDEIGTGVRLVQVRRDRIHIERNGVQQELRIGWSEGIGLEIQPTQVIGGSAFTAKERLMQYRDQRARSRAELLARHQAKTASQ